MNNKKAQYFSAIFKSIIIVAILFTTFFTQVETTPTQRFFTVFDLSTLLISVLIGISIVSKKILLSDIIDILYAVIMRMFVVIISFYLMMDVLMRSLLDTKPVFSVGHIEAHLLFLVLVIILVPTAFVVAGKNESVFK
jgi:hypothetical protein